MAKGVWGLDISKSSVKAVRLESKHGTIELTDVDVIDYTPAAERDDESLEQEIRMALSLFTSRHNLKKDLVAASLPGHTTFNRFIKLPPTDPARLKDIIQYEAQQHIPFPIQEVIWTYQMIERVYQPGEEREAVIFCIKKDLIDKFLGIMTLAGVRIDIIQFAPVSLYNYIMYRGAPDKNVVILDLGANNTDLILVDEDKFWIRNLPIVGNDITKAIQQKFDLPFPEAEKLKISAAQSPQAGKIFTTIQPILKDLVGEVHRSIGYYKSLSPMGKAPNFTRMLAMGNASRVIYFDEFVSQRLQMEIVRFKKLDKIEINEKIEQSNLVPQLASLGVALGLGLQGLNVTTNRINLMPPELIKIKEVSRRKPFVAATLGVVALILLFLYLGAIKTYSELEKADKQAEELIAPLPGYTKKLDAVVKEKDILESKLKKLVRDVPPREIWGKLFTTINGIPALKFKEGVIPPDYLVEQNNQTTLANFEAACKERIWILQLETMLTEESAPREGGGGTEGKEKTRKQYLELTLYCGVMNQGGDEIINTQQFVRDRLAPLVTEFGIGIPLDPKPKGTLSTKLILHDILPEVNDDEPSALPEAAGEKKYFRFVIQLKIPVREED